jgi:hypothetical protein
MYPSYGSCFPSAHSMLSKECNGFNSRWLRCSLQKVWQSVETVDPVSIKAFVLISCKVTFVSVGVPKFPCGILNFRPRYNTPTTYKPTTCYRCRCEEHMAIRYTAIVHKDGHPLN